MTTESNQFPTDDAARWEALARYLAGEAPAGEAAEIERWMAAAPGRRALLDGLRGAVARLEATAPSVDVADALRRVHARIEPAVLPLAAARERRPASGRTMLFRAAAAIVLLLAGGLLLRAVGRAGEEPAPAVAMAAWSTEAGRTESIRLADGTEVLLGPLSRLEVPAGYGSGARNVELDGEALFEVVHLDDAPFSVTAGAGVVQDLGTAFSVRSVDTDEMRVVVTEGVVRLRAASAADDAGVILEAGDRGVLRAGGVAEVEAAAAIDADLAWTQGRLVFVEAPFERVRTDLRRWYGLELRTGEPPPATPPLTTTFDGATRDEVLEVLALVYGVDIEQRGDTAILRGTGGR